MVRVLRKRTMLLISLIVSLLIFFAGFILGYALDKARISDVVKEIDAIEFDRDSYITEQSFFDLFGGDKCASINTRLNSLSKDITDTGKILTDYELRGIFTGGEYKNLKEEYFLSEIKLYIMLKELKNNCNLDRPVILFFYDQEDLVSKQQGYALDAVVRRTQNITVLSIDRELSTNPLIEIVILHYNVNKSPVTIINFDQKLDGFVSVEELLKKIDKK